MRKPLTLEFGRGFFAMGAANGVSLRYWIQHVKRGTWECTIEADGIRRTRMFTCERDAKSYARRDFNRRQLLRVAA